MAKYRKKPVVIEAVQLTWDTWDEVCQFVGVGRLEDGKPAGTDKDLNGKPLRDGGPGLLIPTLEGVMLANPGDWIIKGSKSEIYPCKLDIFEAAYEPVLETDEG